MSVKKILVIVESINVDDSSGSKANVALIQNLHALGYQLKVLHFTPKEINLSGIECVQVPEIKWSFMYMLSRTQRLFTRFTGIKLHKYFENWFGFSFTFFNDVRSIQKTIRKKLDFKPNLVLTLSKGASFRPHYAVLQLPELHILWMAYVHDPYPYHFYPRPFNWVEPGYRQKQNFFHNVSEKAQFSAFPSQLLLEWMGSYFPNFLKTGVVIPHQLNPNRIENVKIPKYFDSNKFTILHAGNLIKPRSPKGLLEGFRLFLKNNEKAHNNVQLILLGYASYHLKLLEQFKAEIPQLFFNNANVSYDIAYTLQQNVSVNVILESKSEISPFLPGKFPHCIAANKPILLLSPHYSETRRLLGNDYPYTSEVDDIEAIAKNIEILYNLWLSNSSDFKLNRNDLEDYLSKVYLRNVIDSIQNN